MKLRMMIAALALLAPVVAHAADLPVKAAATPYAYPSTKCGMYYGVNTMGTTSAVENAAVGTQYVQGAVGLTLGYTCPVGAVGYWFVDGMFDFANLNGNANGLSLSGPAQFEQRFGFGAPVNEVLAIIPGLSALQNALPSLPVLPGASVTTSNPYLYVGLHGLVAILSYWIIVGRIERIDMRRVRAPAGLPATP